MASHHLCVPHDSPSSHQAPPCRFLASISLSCLNCNQVPGHRERKVTVPAGIRSGQLVSIDVPAQKGAVTRSQLDAEEPAEEPASEGEGAEGAEGVGPDAAGDSEEAGNAATVEAIMPRKNEDVAVSPVVFGETPEQQAAAQAVNEVHDLFRKDEDVETKWVPGDTQPIPKLEPLGQTTEDQWTSAPEVYGDQTALHVQSCAARCSSCKTMGAGNWYCQQCGDVCSQINHAESMLQPYTWKVGAPRGAMDPVVQAEAPVKHFLAITAEDKGNYMEQPMIPTKKRWYQKTTQITHFENGGVSQITSNPKWPVQSTGLSALASLYKPGQSPSNLPVLSSLSTVEGQQYKQTLVKDEQRKQVLEEEGPAEEPAEGEVSGEEEGQEAESVEGEGVQSADGEAEAEPEKPPGFIVATPDDRGPERKAPARQTTTNVNVLGPAGPSYVQIHTTPGENPQHFGAYLKPNFQSEYPTTQTITVNPAQPVTRMVASAAPPQPAVQQPNVQRPLVVAPRRATSIVTSYQPAAIAAKHQTMQTTLGSGGLMFQMPAAAGIPLQPTVYPSPASVVPRAGPSVSTSITTPQAPAQYTQQPPTVVTSSSPARYMSSADAVRVASGAPPMVQVVRRQTQPNYQSLSPIPSLKPMAFFDRKRREKQAVFRHWDGKEMQVLNVLPEKPDGEINLDPQNWQGQNMVISEGAKGAKADRQFSEAMMQVTEGLHAAANSELHYKGGDRSAVTYREYGDVNPAVGEPADPSVGGPKLVTADPFGLKAKEASSPLASINDRAGAVPTGSKMEEMVVKVPAGLEPGEQFTAETGAGEEEEVTVPEGVQAGGDVEIDVPEAPQE